MDTIFAVASGRGKAGVSVIRVSGDLALDAGAELVGQLPLPRQAQLRRIKDRAGDLIDEALVLVFERDASFTGEPVVEIQTHGSPAVVNAVLRELASQNGLRLAEPGEFTRRALENGKLDLARVEGLADLIESETEAQRKQAVRVFSGALGEASGAWRRSLIRAAALLDVTIDFSDEDVPEDVTEEVVRELEELLAGLRAEIDGVQAAERLRDGFEVALVGPTNVGKSTLLNRLAGRDAAITSEFAGTTRDVIEVRMDLEGLPVTFLDTAGLRDSKDVIEEIGQSRTRARAAEADLRVFLILESGDRPTLEPEGGDIVLVGKADVSPDGDISGKTGQGVDPLLRQIASVLEGRVGGVGVAVRDRHLKAIASAVGDIEAAVEVMSQGHGREEVAAELLRRAAHALDSLVGAVDVEHILDDIFLSFCLGK